MEKLRLAGLLLGLGLVVSSAYVGVDSFTKLTGKRELDETGKAVFVNHLSKEQAIEYNQRVDVSVFAGLGGVGLSLLSYLGYAVKRNEGGKIEREKIPKKSNYDPGVRTWDHAEIKAGIRR